jgi:molybdopterin converting factor small subunit
VKVWIAQPLRSYTQQRDAVDAVGATLFELLADLERQFPGIRFRMIDEQDRVRRHMRIFVNRVPEENLSTALAPGDEVHIFQALSGG